MSDRLLDLALRLRDLERAAGIGGEGDSLASELVREIGRRQDAAVRGEAGGLLGPPEPVQLVVTVSYRDTDEQREAAIAKALESRGFPPDAQVRGLVDVLVTLDFSPRLDLGEGPASLGDAKTGPGVDSRPAEPGTPSRGDPPDEHSTVSENPDLHPQWKP